MMRHSHNDSRAACRRAASQQLPELAPSRSGDFALRCHHCGKLTDVRTTGRGEEFLHRCRHCHGYHKFTSVGHHGSGAIHYRVTKVAAPAREEKTTAVT
jgi:hypothetical protein